MTPYRNNILVTTYVLWRHSVRAYLPRRICCDGDLRYFIVCTVYLCMPRTMSVHPIYHRSKCAAAHSGAGRRSVAVCHRIYRSIAVCHHTYRSVAACHHTYNELPYAIRYYFWLCHCSAGRHTSGIASVFPHWQARTVIATNMLLKPLVCALRAPLVVGVAFISMCIDMLSKHKHKHKHVHGHLYRRVYSHMRRHV